MVWGGAINPLIPVCRSAPIEWRAQRYGATSGPPLTRAYAQFFEPDVYVEMTEGLLERGGLGESRTGEIARRVVSLAEFTSDRRGVSEPQLGLPLFDVLQHQFEIERRFVLRHQQGAITGGTDVGTLLGLNLIGAFPQAGMDHLDQGYRDVFEPDVIRPDVQGWRKIFVENAMTPRRATMLGIEMERSWRDDPVIYVFDPKNPRDAIDLWNLRIEGAPVWPVPLDWLQALQDDLRSLISRVYRPLRGNSHGVMHSTTIELSRSLETEKAAEAVRSAFYDLPSGAFSLKTWRTPISREIRPGEERHHRRGTSTADTKHVSLRDLGSTMPGRFRSEFQTLAPKCAQDFSGGHARWANVLSFSRHGYEEVGTVLPFNTFDRQWPRAMSGIRSVGIGSEGWVLLQDYHQDVESVTIPSGDNAVIEWMRTKGVTAELSEPGRIAKDALARLNGDHNSWLLANRETLGLLNKMAGALRKRSVNGEEAEEAFPNRTALARVWETHVEQRAKSDWAISVSRFTDAKILRLGLQTICPHCRAPNWRGLDAVDYSVVCDRCLNDYDFPQARTDHGKAAWCYRAIGPFSIPDYGRGAYASILVLRALSEELNPRRGEVTHSTALTLQRNGQEVEVDFAAWVDWAGEHGAAAEPYLVLGEAKSFAHEAIGAKDLKKLREAGSWFEGSVLVVAVLKDEFSPAEKRLLKSFVRWARQRTSSQWVRHHVVLLTGVDLFVRHNLEDAWKVDPHRAKFAQGLGSGGLGDLAELTQAVHLGLPRYHEDERRRPRKRKG